MAMSRLVPLLEFNHERSAIVGLGLDLLSPLGVRNRLNKQRDHLFTFLDHDGVDATNEILCRCGYGIVRSKKEVLDVFFE